ncbi:flagellar motor protein MotB [Colwellia sp. 4_MG-2023]|jgi:chemotaxis protein MotB|uniref:flagellar motor protein MotB n=1 Tax=unclassified Colwellia TaxID=196834 RepID=UPI002090D917|nr:MULTISPECIES: flagellar motor protein MotB [unclassified Colwellia]MDO6487396.1 flagellar motor protein MotB [Colwellia sp. 6_MG-2023]MDO6508304.1 flagellar motor protein MotB [Colwellia sp. 5_MG-2023]MDO6556953.1 flagellar motor protein MotB [Colwellia sp. 4_MG-2023]MDO6652473.1 flagellar motor protein MotB [Colwellia sp. 3_MG-2023]MDO6665652.1 flagellar motor protein MotB [Colwellia sp. 2_MG-2023]
MSNSELIVIKRGRRNKGHGKHGGAWKVAFADFTLAMMAFFMVLWILAITNDAERKKIAHYMRTHSVFDGSPSFFKQGNSPFPIDLGGSPSIIDNQASNRLPPDNPLPGISEYLQVPEGDKEPLAGNGDKLNSAIDSEFAASSELSLLLKSFEELSKEELLNNNILVEEVPSGLRIIIKDDDNHTMFAPSQKTMSPFFEDLFLYLGGMFKDINNKIIISGHSDASPFKGQTYTNWELSAERAQQARKIMAAGGMPASRVMQVNSFSSNRLLNKKDKTASENRRVELLVLTSDAEKKINDLFADDNVQNPIKQSASAATANKPVMRLESNDE